MFFKTVCEALRKAKIPYALVGGYAVALHGVPRGTADIDFVIKWSLDNLKKTEETLKNIGLVSRLPLDAESVFRFRKEYIEKRNLVAWNFYNPCNPLDQVDLIITFDLAKAKAKTVHFRTFPVRILAKPDLIKMKKKSGRPQDLADVEMLEGE